MKTTVVRIVVAFAFLGAGVTHFTKSALFAAIVPPGLGDPLLDVRLSGIAEICGAVGLVLPATRRAAAIGLLLLLVAVWPANWYMALHADRFASLVPAWMLWARLPLQLPIAAIVVWVGELHKDRRRRGSAADPAGT